MQIDTDQSVVGLYNRAMRPPCTICGKSSVAFGYCDGHYRRYKRHGDPLAGRQFGLTNDERFISKYAVDSATDCWVWLRGLGPDGYGSFYDGTTRPNGNPRMVRAHRWSYERHVGPIPPGHEVCHRCDNPSCVNPDHLFVGTHTDNMRDSSTKGRQGHPGARNGRARLTADDVKAARAEYTGRFGQVAELARRFGVTTASMSKVIRRQTWIND